MTKEKEQNLNIEAEETEEVSQEEKEQEDVKSLGVQESHLPMETVESLQDHIVELEKQSQENWDKALRAMSEVENLRKRSQRDIENAHKYSIGNFAESLLPIIDSLEHALQSVDHPAQEGVALTLKMFIDILNKHNITQIDPVGESFDPNIHEAMSIQENDEVEANTVLIVYQKGYLLNGRVIRPARVVVSKKMDKNEPSGDQ